MGGFMFALGGTSKAENSLYDESGAAYRQMVPKELWHKEQSKGEKMKAIQEPYIRGYNMYSPTRTIFGCGAIKELHKQKKK